MVQSAGRPLGDGRWIGEEELGFVSSAWPCMALRSVALRCVALPRQATLGARSTLEPHRCSYQSAADSRGTTRAAAGGLIFRIYAAIGATASGVVVCTFKKKLPRSPGRNVDTTRVYSPGSSLRSCRCQRF
eukprot:scaffold259_cov252-Pinguiococcus_pyrenoidosus.AAC.45